MGQAVDGNDAAKHLRQVLRTVLAGPPMRDLNVNRKGRPERELGARSGHFKLACVCMAVRVFCFVAALGLQPPS